MVRTALLLGFAFLMASFAGCILEVPEDVASEASAITKKVVVTIEPDRWDNEDEEPQFEDFVKTRFEYRHEGSDIAPDQVTAEFLGERGEQQTVPLSRFTTQSNLRTGDVVTIPGANLTSGLVLRAGQEVLAQRTGIIGAWYKIDGYPIPIAGQQAGRIDYKFESEGKVEFEATNFDIDDRSRVHFAKGRLSGKVDGTATLKTIGAALGPRIELSSVATPDIDALVEARITEEGETYDTGMRVYDDRGTFEALVALQFDQDRELRKVGSSSKQFFDMRVQIWDQEHSRASNHEPEGITHPMLDEDQAYREEDVERGDSPEAWAVAFLERIWNTAVAVGDDYRLHFESNGGPSGPRITFDLVLQVAAAENRLVGATTYPSLRVSQVGNLIIDPKDGSPADFELLRSTYWISTDSYLPLYAQSTHSQSFDRNKINTLFALMGEEAPEDLPDAATIVLNDKVTISLQSYSGDFMIAPLIGLMSANQGWLTGVAGAASTFFLISDLGGSTDMTSPDIAWNMNDDLDRLLVASASSGADWNRLAVEVTSCDVFPTGGTRIFAGDEDWAVTPNRPATSAGAALNEASSSDCGTPSSQMIYAESSQMRPGDYIELCAATSELQTANTVRVMVKDMWSNTILAVHTFNSVARC